MDSTDQIRAYLASSWAYLRAECELLLRTGSEERLRSAAGEVLVSREGRVRTVREVHAGLVAALRIRSSSIPEVGELAEARRCSAVADELDPVAGRALLVYARYFEVDLDVLESRCCDALEFAHRETYGAPRE